MGSISTFFPLLILALGLSMSACSENSAEHAQSKRSGIELPPPPSSKQPSRPSRPAPAPNQTSRKSVAEEGIFAPHPALERTLNSNINNSLFPFQFEQPGEVAAPRQLTFAGVLNSSLSAVDFPAFELQLWSNNIQETTPVYRKHLLFEEELRNVYSFQLTTPDAIASGLYYYLIKDDEGKVYYANKVIVDY